MAAPAVILENYSGIARFPCESSTALFLVLDQSRLDDDTVTPKVQRLGRPIVSVMLTILSVCDKIVLISYSTFTIIVDINNKPVVELACAADKL